MRTVEQMIRLIRRSESEFVANTLAEELAGVDDVGTALEILLRAGVEGGKVFDWADVSPIEAQQLIDDPVLLAEGRADRPTVGPIEDEEVLATFDEADDEASIAAGLPPGANPVSELEFDGANNQIVARMDDGTPLIISPVTGQLTKGVLTDEDDPPPFLGGLPEDYTVGSATGLVGQSPWDTADTRKSPQYRDGDQLDRFAGLAPEVRKQIAAGMVAAGYLDEDTFEVYGGIWTVDHARAMSEAMTEANIAAISWNEMLEQKATAIEEAGGLDALNARDRVGSVRTVPAYREPDFATLAQDAKAVMRAQLQRDPLDWEMELLADEMSQAYRSQYDSEVQAARQEFDAGNHARVEAEGGADVFTTGGTVQAVDPQARLREFFERTYEDEIDLQEDRREGAQNAANVFSKLTSVSRLMGG